MDRIEPRHPGVTLRFDELGQELLEEALREDDTTLDELLDRALIHFACELYRGRTAAVPPRLAVLRSDLGGTIEVRPLTPQRWERLRVEAQRWHVPVERVLEHALLLYLADLDAGRAAAGSARD